MTVRLNGRSVPNGNPGADRTKVAGRVERVYTVIEEPTNEDSQAETWRETIVSLRT